MRFRTFCLAAHLFLFRQMDFFAHLSTVFACFSLVVVNTDYDMEGTNVALAVFIPTVIILVVVLAIYVYFAK